jgi:hypothetical protein
MSPLLFLIQLLLLLALGLIVIVALSLPSDGSLRHRLRVLAEPWLERERYVASGMGWDLRVWLSIRGGALALGVGLGWLIGTPVVIVGAAAVALFGLPWWLTARAARRKLEMDRALIPFMINLVNLLRQGQQTLNHALRDLARNPDPRLADALLPLRNAESVGDALVEVARRGLSPMLDRVCVDLLLSLDQSPEAFIDQVENVLLPQYDQDVELQVRNHASLVGGRQNGLLVILIMVICFVVVMRVDSLRAVYASVVGQLMLVLDGGMVFGVLAFLGAMTPRTPWVRWDVAAVREQLRRRYM